ncbi:glycosyltransferase [Crossiella cryophila]|uniref:Sterol 3beta-glucosyltransferase n=1 Tax=Crossiella cryophila TaxID=43355 RepID=A0A7W7CHT5_9PSEU|nr:glycosyltransferase [Crossiella cryophila]MBB4681446.1 sterol 3beta-glucosyltransferase [Crossiella cryophila]
MVNESRTDEAEVVVLAMGTRGDVEPPAALAAALTAAGHRVRLATHVGFRELATGAGAEFAEIHGDPQSLLASPAVRLIMQGRAERSPRLVLAGIRQAARTGELAAGPGGIPFDRRLMASIWTALDGAAALVSCGVLGGVSREIALARGLRCVDAAFQPLHPTTAFPAMATQDLPVPPAGHRLTHVLAGHTRRALFRGLVRKLLAEHGLSPAQEHAVLTLYGFSPAVVPAPRDWSKREQVTGYWFRQAVGELPARVADFLAAGPPPVYVGFGSMAGVDPGRITRMVCAAARRANDRLILAAGWWGLGAADLGPDVLVLDEPVAHELLFPRLRAAVHHGGAGTTAQVLRAGIPSVVVPFVFDAYFWARRVRELGVAAPPLPGRNLNEDRLAAALRVTRLPNLVAAAKTLGRRIRTEDGAGTAARLLIAELNSTR